MSRTGILVAIAIVRSATSICPVCILNSSMAEVVLPSRTIVGYEEFVSICEQVVGEAGTTDLHNIMCKINNLNCSDEFFEDINLSHLSHSAQKEVTALLGEFKDIFKIKDATLGCTSKVKHRIITEDVHLIAKAPYRDPLSQKQVLEKEIDGLLQNGIIKESPWSVIVVLVKRKMEDGSTKVRLCIDFRALNEVTRKDFFLNQTCRTL